MKQNYKQWHKNCALEVTSFSLKRALSNVSKNETENELPTKMTRTILPVQQSISNAICFFCDSAGVFSKQDFAGSQKQIKNQLLHRVESFNRDGYVWQAATQMRDAKLWAKLSEGDMIAREACYHQNCMTKFRNTFPKFPTIKKVMLKTFRKVLKLLQLPSVYHLLNIISKIVMRLHLS